MNNRLKLQIRHDTIKEALKFMNQNQNVLWVKYRNHNISYYISYYI